MSKFDPQPKLNDENVNTTLVPRETRDDQGQAVTYYAEEVEDGSGDDDGSGQHMPDWLSLARDSYTNSTEWLQSDMYKQWERNISNFRSKHPPGSKYHTAAYKHRSKMFRPKTRTAARKFEAGTVSALFNNEELVNIKPQNSDDPVQVASAAINKELVQERLTTDIPWYMLVVGATQDAGTYGAVISHQYWEFVEINGKVVKDTPVCEIIPPENMRVSRSAKWTDPLNSSPYLIQLMPMFIGDVIDKMKTSSEDNKTGQPPWNTLSKEELRAASKEDFDGLRAQRHTPQVDPLGTTRTPAVTEFDTVWIHRNFIRQDGVDYIYYTAGTEYLLSDPIPTQQAYPYLNYGERPYAMGTAAIEAHKVFPDSYVEMGQGLQSIANDIANRRHDNVLLAMDKRFIMRREANIDRDQLFRTVPGGGIETDNPNDDIKIIETNDVTGSAYAEQDRINGDFDDLLGTFNQNTMANSKAGGQVGTMQMTMSESGGMTDYVIRTLLMTWVRPVISQLVRLEQYYEDDLMLIAVAAQKAQVYQKYGVDSVTDEMLSRGLTVNINVGIGATDPARRIEMLMQGTTALTQIPGIGERLEGDEFVKEIYGAIGYDDGTRFVKPVDENEPTPREQELMAYIQQLETEKQGKVTEAQGRIDMERVRQQGQVEEARIRGEYTLALESMKQRIDDMNVLIAAEKNDLARGELEMERDALVYQMKAQQLNIRLEDERESRQIARDFMVQGETGKTTPAADRPNKDTTPSRASPRVGDSGAGVISRNDYGMVPFAEG